MGVFLLLIFFRSICLYLQDIVLGVYDRLFRPKNIFLLPSANNKCRSYRSNVSSGWGGSAAYNRLVDEERARLYEQIRMRKQARKARK